VADAAGAWDATLARASGERLGVDAQSCCCLRGRQERIDVRIAQKGDQTLGERAQLLVGELGQESVRDGHAAVPFLSR
jgi:hypothetical protein